MSRIGIYSGTFDPVHVGHVEFALKAVRECALRQVVLMAEPSPRQKSPEADIDHRQAMIKVAIAGHDELAMLHLDSATFTVTDTLPVLQKKFADDQLVFLLGSDLARTFSYRWPGLGDFLAQVELVVGMRDSEDSAVLQQLLRDTYAAYKVPERFKVLTSPHEHLASTHIRLGSHNLTDLNPSVADYIQRYKLYTA